MLPGISLLKKQILNYLRNWYKYTIFDKKLKL